MKPKTKDEYIAFRLPKNLKNLIRKKARKKGLNISGFVRKAIQDKLN